MKVFSEDVVEYKKLVNEVSLGREHTDIPCIKVSTSRDAFEYFSKILPENKTSIYEMVYALYLNRSNNTVGYALISVGSDVGTVVPVKKILQIGLLLNAYNIVLCHNHPSGNITASESDIAFTDKLKAACELMEMHLLDHIIIAYDKYYSFADDGKL